MAAPRAPGAGGAGWRLAGIGLLGVGVAAAIYTAGPAAPARLFVQLVRYGNRSRPSRCWRPSCWAWPSCRCWCLADTHRT